MSRNAYLLAHLADVDAKSTFKPLVLYARTDEELQAYKQEQLKLRKKVFHIYFPQGATNTAEPATLPQFFATQQLGSPYVVEQVRP